MKLSTLNPQPPAKRVPNPHPSTAPSAPLPFSPFEGESTKAFEAFLLYFDIAENRSFVKVANATSTNLGTVKLWARKYRWKERVRDYHIHLLRSRVDIETEVRKQTAADWAARAELLRQAEWAASYKLIQAAHDWINVFATHPPEELSVTDVSRALEIASRLGRLAVGLHTSKTELTGQDGGPINVEFEAALKKIYGPEHIDLPDAPPEALPPIPQPSTLNQIPIPQLSTPLKPSTLNCAQRSPGRIALNASPTTPNPSTLNPQPSTPLKPSTLNCAQRSPGRIALNAFPTSSDPSTLNSQPDPHPSTLNPQLSTPLKPSTLNCAQRSPGRIALNAFPTSSDPSTLNPQPSTPLKPSTLNPQPSTTREAGSQ